MPRSLKYKLGFSTITALFLIPTIFAFSSRWNFEKPKAVHRDVAMTLKMERAMGKQLAALAVQVPSLESVPETDGEQVHIIGYITAHATNGSAISYHWDLPAGVAIVAGDVDGILSDMKSGDTTELEIVVTGFSREVGKHIILGAKVRRGQDELNHSALVASRPEDSMEYVASQMHSYAQATRAKEFKNGRMIK